MVVNINLGQKMHNFSDKTVLFAKFIEANRAALLMVCNLKIYLFFGKSPSIKRNVRFIGIFS